MLWGIMNKRIANPRPSTLASSTYFTPGKPKGLQIVLPEVDRFINTHELQTVANRQNPPGFRRSAIVTATANLSA